MKRSRLVALILILFTFGVRAHASDYIPGQILVQLQRGVNVTFFNTQYHTTTVCTSAFSNTFCLCTTADVPTLITLLANDPRILAVGPNLSNQALANSGGSGFGSRTPTLQWVADADAVGQAKYTNQPAVNDVDYGPISAQYDGSGVTVAILDTGISLRNKGLAAQVTSGWNFVDNNGNTDDSPSGIDSNGDGTPDGVVGHGTMVAGIVQRFAPGATLLPIKVLDSDGQGSLWEAIEGVRYAVASGARVLNLSFGSPTRSPLLEAAIDDATQSGALVITAAGNSDSAQPQYPAGYSETIAVAGLSDNDKKAPFSNYGNDVDVDAPAVAIVSTYWDGRIAAWSGTSFSAPMVSAEAALIICAKPRIHIHHIRHLILETANSVDDLNPRYEGLLGEGLIDFDQALGELN